MGPHPGLLLALGALQADGGPQHRGQQNAEKKFQIVIQGQSRLRQKARQAAQHTISSFQLQLQIGDAPASPKNHSARQKTHCRALRGPIPIQALASLMKMKFSIRSMRSSTASTRV